MSGITVYMEGGGPGNTRALRLGMVKFLGPLRELARSRTLRFRVVPCGSREKTWSRFQLEAGRAGAKETCVLLVDAEGSVGGLPRTHLRKSDGWDLSGIPESVVHLMVQVMETWIVADPKNLAGYYGQGFKPGSLPARTNLEREPKAAILSGLHESTRRTSKGRYDKIKHASELLELIDPARVQARCRHCKRLFVELQRIIATSP